MPKKHKAEEKEDRPMEKETSLPRRLPLVISNPSDVARGIQLSGKAIVIQPGEVITVPLEDEEEVRLLFSSEAAQRWLDSGLLRIGGLKDEEPVAQETPEPPANLTSNVTVGNIEVKTGLGESPIEVVDHQIGGPIAQG